MKLKCAVGAAILVPVIFGIGFGAVWVINQLLERFGISLGVAILILLAIYLWCLLYYTCVEYHQSAKAQTPPNDLQDPEDQVKNPDQNPDL